jgi:hypothetical protein
VKEQDKLHREYMEMKKKEMSNVNFKCHICHAVMKVREHLREHLEEKHPPTASA